VAYATWEDVPVGQRNQLEALKDHWGALVGYVYEPTKSEMLIMANLSAVGAGEKGVATIHDFGQWMWRQGTFSGMPWAALGIERQQYDSLFQSYGNIYETLTGQKLDPHLAAGQTNFWFDSMTQKMGGTEFRASLMHNENLQKTYGWLKHGMTYDDFQLQRQQMRMAFGHDLSNDEAVQQLTYFKRAQGADFSVSQKPSPQQQQREPAGAGSQVR
jgi:hypothetical protein